MKLRRHYCNYYSRTIIILMDFQAHKQKFTIFKKYCKRKIIKKIKIILAKIILKYNNSCIMRIKIVDINSSQNKNKDVSSHNTQSPQGGRVSENIILYKAGYIAIKQIPDKTYLWKCYKCNLKGTEIFHLKDIKGTSCYLFACNCQLNHWKAKEYVFLVPFKFVSLFKVKESCT